MCNFTCIALFAKLNSISTNFNIKSLVNNHFSFIATSTSSSPVTGYFWDYGDGNNSGWQSSDIVNHSYTATGTYSVKLVVQNGAGERDSVVKVVNAYKYSTGTDADFTISRDIIYTGDTVQFTNTSTSTAGVAIARWWSFGNAGGIGNVENPTKVFTQPGLYSINLTAENSITGPDTTLKTIRVLQGGVVANFSFPAGRICQHETVQFNDTSTSGPGNIISWHWQFGDGSTSTLQNPAHAYDYGGNYTVQLIVHNDLGQADTIVKNVTITRNASAKFGYSPTLIYTKDSVKLIDSSIAVCGSITQWKWQCRGLSPANIGFTWSSSLNIPPLVNFPDSGKYEVTLIANEDTITKIIEVYPYIQRTTCIGGTFKLPAFKAGSTYKWQESRNNGVSFFDAAAPYFYSGFYTDTLTVQNFPSAWNGNLYKCLVDGKFVVLYRVAIQNQFVGTGAWENIDNWSCHSVPDANTDVVITGGVVTINSNAVCRTLTVLPGANVVVSEGFSLTVLH